MRVVPAFAAATAVVALVATAGPTVAAERKAPAGTPAVRATAHTGAVPLGSGIINYDNGTPFSRHGADGGTVGNNFNDAVDPHGVATVSFRVAGNYATSMVMSVWDVNPGSFMILNRQLVSGIPQSPNPTLLFNATLASPVAAHSGAFVAGIRNTDYDPCAGSVSLSSTCDGVALTMGGVDPGMGFHAFRVPFNSNSFVPVITMVAGAGTVIQNVNAIFRSSGDNLPVELMSFGVE